MADPSKSFFCTLTFGPDPKTPDAGNKVLELAFGSRALYWIEQTKGTSFLKELNAFQKYVDDPMGVSLGDMVFLVRAGCAHLSAVPEVGDVLDLMDRLTKDERTDNDTGIDDLRSMMGKIGAAYTNGIPGVSLKSTKKEPAKGEGEGGGEGKDPTIPPSTGAPS